MRTPMLVTSLSFTQLLLITILPFASADHIDDTCKSTPYADFCISTLKSHPRSSTTDTPTLGLIMVDKVDRNAKSTLIKIKDLLGKSPESRMKQVLTCCRELYEVIRSASMPLSKESLTKGDYKFAVDYMKDAASEASNCEADFGGKSPLSNLNDYENKAASVACAIAAVA